MSILSKKYMLTGNAVMALISIIFLSGYYSQEFSPILVCVCGFLLSFSIYLEYAERLNEYQPKLWRMCFALILSTVIVIQGRVHFTDLFRSYTENYFLKVSWNEVFAILCVTFSAYHLVTIALFVMTKCVQCLQNLSIINDRSHGCSKRKVFIIFALSLLGIWSVFWMTYFPARACGDILKIIEYPLKSSNQHPWLFILIYNSFGKIGEKLFGDFSIGVALFTFFQLLAVVLSISYCASWLYKKKVPISVLILVWCYFALPSTFAAITIYNTKDILWAAVFLLYVPLLYELYENNGEGGSSKFYLIRISIVSIFVILLRNNGTYIVGMLALVWAILLIKRKLWTQIKSFLVFIAAGILLPVLLTSVLEMTILKSPHIFSETVGIPLQQLGMVVTSDEGQLTEEQKEFLFRIYPEEDWYKNYVPMGADILKWNDRYPDLYSPYLQEHKGEFLKEWAQICIPNFKLYVKAYLLETYGFWRISFMKTGFPNAVKVGVPELEAIGIHRIQIWPDSIQGKLEDYYVNSLAGTQEGTLIWIFFFLLLAILYQKQRGRWIVFLPVLVLWGTYMIATPIAFNQRYIWPMQYYLPFSVCAAFFADKKPSRDEGNERDWSI